MLFYVNKKVTFFANPNNINVMYEISYFILYTCCKTICESFSRLTNGHECLLRTKRVYYHATTLAKCRLAGFTNPQDTDLYYDLFKVKMQTLNY